jgi:hypothetical protein
MLLHRHPPHRRLHSLHTRTLEGRNVHHGVLQHPVHHIAVLGIQDHQKDKVRSFPPLQAIYILTKELSGMLRIVKYEDMPIRHFLDIARDNPEPPQKPLKGWKRLGFLWS